MTDLNHKSDFPMSSVAKLEVGQVLDVTFNPIMGTKGDPQTKPCRVVSAEWSGDKGEWKYGMRFVEPPPDAGKV